MKDERLSETGEPFFLPLKRRLVARERPWTRAAVGSSLLFDKDALRRVGELCQQNEIGDGIRRVDRARQVIVESVIAINLRIAYAIKAPIHHAGILRNE